MLPQDIEPVVNTVTDTQKIIDEVLSDAFAAELAASGFSCAKDTGSPMAAGIAIVLDDVVLARAGIDGNNHIVVDGRVIAEYAHPEQMREFIRERLSPLLKRT